MDPITQGIFGGVFAQTLVNKKKIFYGSIVGVISGLAPDLDVLIRSETDPLLSLEYHRQFSHSLIFIPIGALFVSLITSVACKDPKTPPILPNTPLLEQLFILLSLGSLVKRHR